MYIDSINLVRQLIDESLRFHKTFHTLAGEYDLSALGLAAPHAKYGADIEDFDTAVKKLPQTILSQRIVDADAIRDVIYSGFSSAINSALNHYDPAVCAAAAELAVVRKAYKNPVHMSYEKETSALENLCQDLDLPKYSVHVATCGLTGWVAKIKEANNRVIQLLAERRDDKATQTELIAIACRRLAEDDYRTIKQFIEVFVKMHGAGSYAELVRRHNLDIARFNTLLAKRGAVSGSSKKSGKKSGGNAAAPGGSPQTPPAAPGAPVIELVQDETSGSENRTLTPGGILRIFGEGLLLEGSNSSVGVWFHPLAGSGSPVPVPPEDVLLNTPQLADVLIPALPAGAYKVRLTTQYNDGDALLDTPRSTTYDVPLTVN